MSNDSTDKIPNSLENKMDRLIVVVESMDNRLTNLEATVEQRLRATQPIWEAVQKDLAEVKQDLAEVKHDLAEVKHDLAEFRANTEKAFRTIDRRMEKQIGEFERLHAYQRDLEDRVDRIEKLSST